MEIVGIAKYEAATAIIICPVSASAVDPMTCSVSSGHNHVDFGFVRIPFQG